MVALDVTSLSRRELQLLAKELQLCRGNAKSDVIIQHVYDFVAANPANGEQRVIALVGASSDAVVASAVSKEPEEPEEPKEEEARETDSKARVATNGSCNDTDATDSDNSAPKTAKPLENPKELAAAAAQQPERKSKSPTTNSPTNKTPTTKSPANKTPTSSQSETAAKRRRAETTASSISSAAKSPTAAPAVAASVAAKEPAREARAVVTSGKERRDSNAQTKTDEDAAPTVAAPRRALASIENAPAAAPVPADVSAFVAATDDLEFTKDGRVRCSATAHEMKADLAVIQEHLRGKRYARARGLKTFSLADFAPAFSAHPDEKLAAKLVWCNVTGTAIVRTREQIEAHMAGPRYRKELPQWEEEQAAKAKAAAEAAERAQERKLAAMKKRKADAEAGGKSSKRRST